MVEKASRHVRSTSPHLISTAVLAAYEAVAAQFDLDVPSLLRRAGLDRSVLTSADRLAPSNRVIALIEMSASACGARDFGLRLALGRGLPDTGPLNLLLREEPNLGSALRSLQDYLHLHSTSERIHLDYTDDAVILHCSLSEIESSLAAPQSTEMVVCGVVQTLRWLLDGSWAPSMVCLMHRAEGGARALRQVFRAPVEFDQLFNGLLLDPKDLARPILSANPLLRRHAEHYLQELDARSPRAFDEIVTETISDMLPTGACTSAAVARRLGMDRATLGRRLKDYDATYGQLLQHLRVRAASRLCRAGAPLDRVAEQVGFSGPSAFARWFRASFGCPASEWRALPHDP